ncbi:pantetheine-phosphate adenylyltransferase [Leeia sp. TBRC 13508]|uniref:Phosphopantetheine adenylyltransferase n=1 Tax=Leeia speluncae TaxID=2884804 RepID=A0ABS8D647_9NEIS|nr:pantetheine-phosphate adenylyltransferase [Leeia speluncae]MCB6183651.1 pantetheine-phosphate adenylyltransferase [Leeia speluncae]
MNKAVYAGSFDPLTKGHLWMIEQGVKLFDELIVAVGINPDKKYTFTRSERLDMLKESTQHLPNLRVDSFDNQFLVNYARAQGAQYILRGIRTSSDYEYERNMRYINDDLVPSVNTIFLMPPREIAEVSSTMVKGMVGPEGWESILGKYVPEAVLELFKAKNLDR